MPHRLIGSHSVQRFINQWLLRLFRNSFSLDSGIPLSLLRSATRIRIIGQIPAGSVLSAQGPLFGAALAISEGAIRTYVYIDGFNLYYGALKGTSYRWLDPVALTKQLVPSSCVITQVKYFTARVSGAANPGSPQRQQTYLSALNTLPEVQIHFGRFLSKVVWRPITNFPVAGATINSATPATLPLGTHEVVGGSLKSSQRLVVDRYASKLPKRGSAPIPLNDALVVQVHTMEEKGSDVNLGAHLLNDAWKELFDVAVVISNDTDLVTPIRMVTVERQKPVYVVCPGRWQMAKNLADVATFKRHMRRNMLGAAQFPDPIPGTTIRKPTNW